MSAPQIMIVEDESIVAMDIEEALKNDRYVVKGVVGSGREAVETARQARPDLVLMDIHLKGEVDGIQAAREIRERLDIPIIYLTAYSDERTLQRAKMTEPYGFLCKPFEKEDLHSSIEVALHKHRAEKAVKEGRRWLETILRSTGDAVVATDARGLVTFMNPVAERLTGVERGQARSSWTEAVKLRDGAGNPPAALVRAFAEGVPAEFPADTVLVGEGGEARPVDGVLTPALDDKDGLTGFVMAFRDVSARRRLEQELKRTNDELERRVRERTAALIETNRSLQRHVKEVDALYKYAPCGYHSIDRAGAVLRMNQTELNWLGYKPQDVLGRPFVELLSPVCRARFLDNLSILRERGWLKDADYEMVRRDGSAIPVLFNAAREDDDGSGVMARFTVYNMTEKRLAERALMESESKFRCIAESAAEGILVFDEKGIIVYANRGARELFGREKDGMVGRNAEDLVPERQRRRFREALRGFAARPPGSRFATLTAFRGRDGAGREFPVEASVASWAAEGQHFYAAIIRDVADRRRMEAALLHAGKMAAMGQMAAGLAHELKTPLGTIYSFSDVLLSKTADPQVAPTLDIIRRQALRCAGLIDSLLDFARRHKVSDAERTDVWEAVEAALELVEAHAKTRGVAVVRRAPPAALHVRGARNMLEQVVVNLCMNAVDATAAGGTLTVSAEAAAADGRPCARLVVADTGAGIAPEVREKLFEPFNTSKAPGRGTGLGLWLSREIVTGLGGAIACDSAVGKGTVFTVDLPAAPATDLQPEEKP